MENKSDQPPSYYQYHQNFQATSSYPTQAYQQPSYPQQPYQPYPNTNFVGQPQVIVGRPVVVLNGSCPQCGIGFLHDDYGCLAIFLAIFFFPIGVLCCLALREKRCSNCRAVF